METLNVYTHRYVIGYFMSEDCLHWTHLKLTESSQALESASSGNLATVLRPAKSHVTNQRVLLLCILLYMTKKVRNVPAHMKLGQLSCVSYHRNICFWLLLLGVILLILFFYFCVVKSPLLPPVCHERCI